MAKRFEVEITFKQTVRYAVDAESRKAAEQLAMEQWKEGDEENAVGSECCDLVGVNVAEVPNTEGCARDADKAFRYLRDRELVIETLDVDAFTPSIHDAVSAEDVALHVGWRKRDRSIDTPAPPGRWTSSARPAASSASPAPESARTSAATSASSALPSTSKSSPRSWRWSPRAPACDLSTAGAGKRRTHR